MHKIKLYLHKNANIIAFYIGIIILTFAFGLNYDFLDHDIFSRLIGGYSVANFGTVFYNDIVSYTPTHIWYDPEWITSGILYLISQKFGLSGLVITKCLSSILTVFAIILALKERLKDSKESPYNIIFYILILSVFVGSCLLRHSVRCQNITFIILPIWILLLEKIRNGNNKLLYLLPPIMLFWLNCHGGSIAGVGIIILYGIGEFLNKKPFKKYFIVLIFVCLAYFINPWGIDFIKFMFESSYIDRGWIYEWKSPFINLGDMKDYITYFIYLFLSVFACIFSIIHKKISYSKLDKTKIILFIVTAYLSIAARKHIELFAVVSSIFIYEDIYYLYNRICLKLAKLFHINEKLSKDIHITVNIIKYTIIYIVSLIVILNNPLCSKLHLTIPYNFPVEAIEFLRINNIKGNLLTHFEYASYAAWKLYPNIKIYMDGRQEQVYSKEIFDKLMHFELYVGNDPYRVFYEYPPDIVIAQREGGAINIRGFEDWKEIYTDNQFSIFVKKSMAKENYRELYRTNNAIINDMFVSAAFKMGNKLP